jgi:polysaccharide biosynthesis protein PslG
MRATPLLVALLGAAALAAGPAQAKPFLGVVYDGDVTGAAPATQDAEWARMHKTGVQTTRVVFSWADAQPAEGQPPGFGATDATVARAARNEIELLPIVIYAPAWAREDAANGASPPKDPSAYAAYLRALVGRYGPNGTFWAENPSIPKRPLRTWQIWNEPQLRYQWSSRDWEKGYGELLHAAHDALEEADPGSTVVLAGATNFAWDALESLYAKGNVKGQFDVAALHPYTGSASRVLEAVRRFRAVLRRHGDGRRPVWITELAWPASKGRADPPAGLKSIVTTAKGMAARLTRAYRLLAKTHVVQRAYWYTWASGYRRTNGIFDFTGLEHFANGRAEPTQALQAYRRVARAIRG